MLIQAAYTFDESYIPPRCRKPRIREVNETLSVEIKCIKADDAPIAMTHRGCFFPTRCVYRWFEGRLYRRETYYTGQNNRWATLTDLKHKFSRATFVGWPQPSDRSSCHARCIQKANDYLIISGQVWHTCGEPRYVIATFGLGNNHASTALMIDNHFNENIQWQRYFRADDRKAAVTEALRVATARGDTRSLPDIKASWPIKVLIPEAVQCNPKTWGGEGDAFLNTLDILTTAASSASEAAVLVTAAALANL